jgi:hypothetical protein
MAPLNLLIIVIVGGVILMALLTLGYIVYTSTRDAYKSVYKKVGDHYSARARIKQWEQEELNREMPREYMGSH